MSTLLGIAQNIVHIKPSEAQLLTTLYYPNGYPSIHARNVSPADSNRRVLPHFPLSENGDLICCFNPSDTFRVILTR